MQGISKIIISASNFFKKIAKCGKNDLFFTIQMGYHVHWKRKEVR